MELVSHEITLPNYKTVLYGHHITDVHRESDGCDDKKFRADLKAIKDANEDKKRNELHVWTGGGDWNNGITGKDKRFDATAISSQFRKYHGTGLHQAVCNKLIQEARDVAPYCLGYGRGNHEDGVLQYNGFDPADYVAKGLNVNYLGYEAAIRLLVGYKGSSHRSSVIIYWHHGYGAARSPGAKKNMMMGLRHCCDNADIYLTGHVHEHDLSPKTRLTVSKKGTFRQHADDILFINGGSYMKNYSPDQCKAQKAGEYNEDRRVIVDYAAKKAYEPAVIGHFGWSLRFCKVGPRGSQRWKKKLNGVDFR